MNPDFFSTYFPRQEKGRDYEELYPGIIKYTSPKGDPKLNLNGIAKDIKSDGIVCRHLAFYVFSKGIKNYQRLINTRESILSQPLLRYNIYDNENILRSKDSTHFFFLLEELGVQLQKIANSLRNGNALNFMFYSESHAMAIRIKLKPVGYTIKFYDPNRTITHIRLLCRDLESVGQINIDDFLTLRDTQSYFSNSNVAILTTFDIPKKQTTPMAFISQAALMQEATWGHLLEYGFDYNLPELIHPICDHVIKRPWGSKDVLEVSYGLYIAFKSNNVAAITAFCKVILNSNLSKIAKIKYLRAEDDKGLPILFKAMKKPKTRTLAITAYCREIILSNLPEKHMVELLASRRTDGKPALYEAFKNANHKKVISYCRLILLSNLSTAAKFTLLAARKTNGDPGLATAILNEDTDLVVSYCQLILDANLDTDTKAKLIYAAESARIPSIVIASINDDEKTLKAYYKILFSSQGIRLMLFTTRNYFCDKDFFDPDIITQSFSHREKTAIKTRLRVFEKIDQSPRLQLPHPERLKLLQQLFSQ